MSDLVDYTRIYNRAQIEIKCQNKMISKIFTAVPILLFLIFLIYRFKKKKNDEKMKLITHDGDLREFDAPIVS